MEDVLEVYARPSDPARPVICLDEKAVTLRDTPRGEQPVQPRQPRRQDYEYSREGTCNIFLAVEPLVGQRTVQVRERRTLVDFADILREVVDAAPPEVEQIVLVTDNLNTHTPAALYARFAPEEARRIARKIEWHYTPEHGSWLNIAECELSVLARQCLRRRLPTQAQVAVETAAWQRQRNQTPSRIRWQFTTADARIKLRSLYPEIIHN
jgi:hypothetical protein